MAFLCVLVFFAHHARCTVLVPVRFLHAYTSLLATAAHHIPAVTDPAKSRRRRKRLLNQHRVAWVGICLLLYRSLWPFYSNPFLCLYLSFLLYIMETRRFLLMDHHSCLGPSSVDRIPFECAHFDEDYIDALKGIHRAFI